MLGLARGMMLASVITGWVRKGFLALIECSVLKGKFRPTNLFKYNSNDISESLSVFSTNRNSAKKGRIC